MKAVIAKSDLVNLVGKLQNVVASKPVTPILGNVLLEAADDQVIISGTDMTVSMRCFIDAKVIEEGAIALPARRFFQLIRELTTSQIKISAPTNEIAEITTGTSVFKINGMGKAEFPAFPDLTGAFEINLTQSQLKETLLKTSFSAARDDTRYMLNGVQVQIANQKVTFMGTDGKRLARAAISTNLDPSVQGNFVIPIKAVDEMIKVLDDHGGKIHLNLAHDKISLESGNLTLVSKLLSGQYPDVERVIPLKSQYQFTIHREELSILLRQIALFTSEMSSSVRLTFEAGALHLSAMSNEIGEGKVSMPVDYTGPMLEIAFNPYFFIDILRHIKEETFPFGLNDPHSPGVIRILSDNTELTFVIMPMRLNAEAPLKKEASVP